MEEAKLTGGMWRSDHHTVRTTIHPTIIPSRDYNAAMISDHEYPTEMHRYSSQHHNGHGEPRDPFTVTTSCPLSRINHTCVKHGLPAHTGLRLYMTKRLSSSLTSSTFAYAASHRTCYRLSPLTIIRQKCMYTRMHHHGQGARQAYNI